MTRVSYINCRCQMSRINAAIISDNSQDRSSAIIGHMSPNWPLIGRECRLRLSPESHGPPPAVLLMLRLGYKKRTAEILHFSVLTGVLTRAVTYVTQITAPMFLQTRYFPRDWSRGSGGRGRGPLPSRARISLFSSLVSISNRFLLKNKSQNESS